ncbi:hypothetical protein [uncultured Amnibacterium sp.]|uniref:hypothetical protein n=1 Tax=uncultured Amnibacterium sp. TaxID=1631851 RepID=UPI0035C9ABAF
MQVAIPPAREIQLREQSGLRYDTAWIEQVDAASTSTSTELGIPLTPSESAVIKGRDRLNSVLGAIESLGGKSTLFGGVAIDLSKPSGISIALTSDPLESAAASTLLDSLKILVPQGTEVAVTVQDTPLAQLRSTYEALSRDWADKKLEGLHVTTIGQFPTHIMITTSGDSPATVQEELRARYNAPFISVTQGSGPEFQASRNQASGPLYGGIAISTDENQNLCTSGFSRARGGASGTSYYEITAGHCNPPGYHWHEGDYSTNGDHFGTGTNNNGAYGGGTSKCDCQSIGPVPASAATKNFLSSNNVVSSQMTGLPSNTDDSAGYGINRKVCVSGAVYGQTHGGDLTCGYIGAQNYSDQPVTTTVTNLILTNAFGTVNGDSGGTVIAGSDFMGIHQGTVNVQGTAYELFSRSVYMASVTGATPTF